MKSKDKKGLYLAIAGIFAIVVIIRVSYAYLPTDDLANEPQGAQASTATLKLKYTDCASDVQSDCADIAADLKHGESITKTSTQSRVLLDLFAGLFQG